MKINRPTLTIFIACITLSTLIFPTTSKVPQGIKDIANEYRGYDEIVSNITTLKYKNRTYYRVEYTKTLMYSGALLIDEDSRPIADKKFFSRSLLQISYTRILKGKMQGNSKGVGSVLGLQQVDAVLGPVQVGLPAGAGGRVGRIDFGQFGHGAVSGFFRPLKVDVLRSFGRIGQDHHALARNLDKPAPHGQSVALPVDHVFHVATAQRAGEAGVTGFHAEIALFSR